MKRFISFAALSLSIFIFVLSGSSFAEGLKIAIVTSPNDVHDGGFNETNYNGAVAFVNENPEST